MSEPFLSRETLDEMQSIEEGANTARLDLYRLHASTVGGGGRTYLPVIVAGDVPCRLGLVSPLEAALAGQDRAANQYRVTVPLATDVPAEAYVHVHAVDGRPADLWLRVVATDHGRSYATRLRLECVMQIPPGVDLILES